MTMIMSVANDRMKSEYHGWPGPQLGRKQRSPFYLNERRLSGFR